MPRTHLRSPRGSTKWLSQNLCASYWFQRPLVFLFDDMRLIYEVTGMKVLGAREGEVGKSYAFCQGQAARL